MVQNFQTFKTIGSKKSSRHSIYKQTEWTISKPKVSTSSNGINNNIMIPEQWQLRKYTSTRSTNLNLIAWTALKHISNIFWMIEHFLFRKFLLYNCNHMHDYTGLRFFCSADDDDDDISVNECALIKCKQTNKEDRRARKRDSKQTAKINKISNWRMKIPTQQ